MLVSSQIFYCLAEAGIAICAFVAIALMLQILLRPPEQSRPVKRHAQPQNCASAAYRNLEQMNVKFTYTLEIH